MTATVETVSEPLDLAAIMPSENVVTAVARSVTLSDADVGKIITLVNSSPLVLSMNMFLSNRHCFCSQATSSW